MRPHATDRDKPTVIRLDAERAVRHLDQLYRYAFSITGNHDEAEDLVHDVFEILLRRPPSIRARDNERAYLLAMLRHRYVDALRARRRRPQVVVERPGEEQEARAAEGPAARAEQREVLSAIAGLALNYRETLVAVDVAGLSYAEAASVLGVPVGTVMSRVHRARARVVAALDEPRASAGRFGKEETLVGIT
jgi:RNA polymerase sigma-70 factor, ECF subfamily